MEDASLGQGKGPGPTLGHDVRAVHDDLPFLDHVGETLVGGAHSDCHGGQFTVDEINNALKIMSLFLQDVVIISNKIDFKCGGQFLIISS